MSIAVVSTVRAAGVSACDGVPSGALLGAEHPIVRRRGVREVEVHEHLGRAVVVAQQAGVVDIEGRCDRGVADEAEGAVGVGCDVETSVATALQDEGCRRVGGRVGGEDGAGGRHGCGCGGKGGRCGGDAVAGAGGGVARRGAKGADGGLAGGLDVGWHAAWLVLRGRARRAGSRGGDGLPGLNRLAPELAEPRVGVAQGGSEGGDGRGLGDCGGARRLGDLHEGRAVCGGGGWAWLRAEECAEAVVAGAGCLTAEKLVHRGGGYMAGDDAADQSVEESGLHGGQGFLR